MLVGEMAMASVICGDIDMVKRRFGDDRDEERMVC